MAATVVVLLQAGRPAALHPVTRLVVAHHPAIRPAVVAIRLVAAVTRPAAAVTRPVAAVTRPVAAVTARQAVRHPATDHPGPAHTRRPLQQKSPTP
jgi:hypothetical protein